MSYHLSFVPVETKVSDGTFVQIRKVAIPEDAALQGHSLGSWGQVGHTCGDLEGPWSPHLTSLAEPPV